MSEKVRLDKWLWAARLFKTRTLAKAAIDSGKVTVDTHKTKCSREIEPGSCLQVKIGWEEKTLIVTGLSTQRRGAKEAAALYCETEESLNKRKKLTIERRLARASFQPSPQPPNKKQRRQIHRFKTKTL